MKNILVFCGMLVFGTLCLTAKPIQQLSDIHREAIQKENELSLKDPEAQRVACQKDFAQYSQWIDSVYLARKPKLDSIAKKYNFSPQDCLLVRNELVADYCVSLLKYDLYNGTTNAMSTDAQLDLSNYRILKDLPVRDSILFAYSETDLLTNVFEFAIMRRFCWMNGEGKHTRNPYSINWLKTLPEMAKTDSLLFGDGPVSLLTKAAFLNALSRNCSRAFSGTDAEADSLRRELDSLYKPFLQYPTLCQRAEKCVESYIARRNYVYDLPQCEASVLLRQITESYRGKWVIIDFWAMGCSPCRQEIEESLQTRTELRDSPLVDFVFITSDNQSPLKAYSEYVEKNLKGEDCRRLTGEQYSQMENLFKFNATPHYELMDPEGRIVIAAEARVRSHLSSKDFLLSNFERLNKILFGK